MSIITKFVGFLSKYSHEAVTIAGAIKTIIEVVPLPKNEKRRVEKALEEIEGIPLSLDRAIKEIKKIKVVAPSKEEITEAVAELLPGILAKILEDRAKDNDENEEKKSDAA